MVTFIVPDLILCNFVDCDRLSSSHLSTMSTEIEPDPLLCRLCWPWSTPIGWCLDSVDCFWKWFAHGSSLSTVIEHDRVMFRLCQHWSTLIGSYVDFVDWILPCYAHLSFLSNEIMKSTLIGPVSTLVTFMIPNWILCDFVDCDGPSSFYLSTMSTDIDPDPLICRLYWPWLTPFGSCIDRVDCFWKWLAQVSTPSVVIEYDRLMYRLCQHWSTLIGSNVDFGDWIWPWYAHVSTLSNEIMKSTLIGSSVDSGDLMVPDLILCEFVGCVEWNLEIDTHWFLCRFWWLLSYLIWSCATLSTVIDPLLLICHLCRLRSTLILFNLDSVDRDRPRLADVSTLSTVFESNLLMCRLFRLWLNMIASCIDSVNIDRPWLAHMSTLSTEFDPDMLMCRLCRLKLTLIRLCVEYFDQKPKTAHLLILSIVIDPAWRMWRIYWP